MNEKTSKPESDGQGSGMTKYSVAPAALTKQAQGVREDGHLIDCRLPVLGADGVCASCGAKVRG